jgi:hypothetical protein
MAEASFGCQMAGLVRFAELRLLHVRAMPHGRGCRGTYPDLGEPLLEEANHSFESRADTAGNPMRQPTKKRKSRITIDDGPDISTAATWVGTPATATTDGGIAAPTTTARATEPLTASKRIKLPDTNKRKAVSPPDREPQTTPQEISTGPVTAVGFASINVDS